MSNAPGGTPRIKEAVRLAYGLSRATEARLIAVLNHGPASIERDTADAAECVALDAVIRALLDGLDADKAVSA